ncbi:MAG: ATP-dependent zinc metalloprotease FtsH [Rhodospirillaceae bacterium]|nr:ATP-dependent metallopeptidase FtsH/Yme1/Tma family protein [Alphaproteobacteria bacterium]MCA3249194.1 ATP-dependent zinc metalloprotease FtsH [Rhodospirillaceae bacterium]
MVPNAGRNLAIWIIVGLLLMALFNLLQVPMGANGRVNLAFSDFLQMVDSQQVNSVMIQGPNISGQLSDNRNFVTYAPNDPSLVERLTRNKVKITAAPQDDSGGWIGILLSWFPMLLFIGVWVFFMRQMQGGGGKAMGFGRSRARMLTEKHGQVTFNDVAGIDEAKQELEEVVEFLKAPQKFQKLGAKIPKGVLLIGPPGTGKTLLARAIAGEAGVPFFTISGSDFVEMFVGVGASRVRDMFEQAKKNAPCIIFIDEIDAVGRHRGVGMGGGNDEREQTLNQLLVEMDGFEANEGVILVAATNRPDVLDPALLRPGRFDRQVVVPNPDVRGREQILRVHMKKVPLATDVEPSIIARGTPGFSGADLANIVNEAALVAARKNRRSVTMGDFEQAKDKVFMGAERRSMAMSEDEKRLTAYHEGGHALVGLSLPDSDPVHKATIVPRGRALGMVMRLPEGDRYSSSRAKLKADLAVAMGGRVAEEIIFGHDKVTTGASSDIKMATDMARKMVTEWGLSDALGPLAYGEPEGDGFLGYASGQRRAMSNATAEQVDREIRNVVQEGYETAKRILTDRLDDLHKLAHALLEHETLSGDDINTLLGGGTIDRTNTTHVGDAKSPPRRGSVPRSKPTIQPV